MDFLYSVCCYSKSVNIGSGGRLAGEQFMGGQVYEAGLEGEHGEQLLG